MKILITGVAGFIGFHLAQRLLNEGHEIIGIDNLNDYYDTQLKQLRLNQILTHPHFIFHRMDITDMESVSTLFQKYFFDQVVHLAAQSGVRFSLENPRAYIQANILGFFNVIERSRINNISHFVFASSSSVYGSGSHSRASKETDETSYPLSLYATTKRSNEMLAYNYATAHQLNCTGLRLFSVYGPWGRPDMAYYKFTQNIFDDKPIEVYNAGTLARDYTYIDDAIEAIIKILNSPPYFHKPSLFNVYNVGNGIPVTTHHLIQCLEQELDHKACILFTNKPPTDPDKTWANVEQLQYDYQFKPCTSIEQGIKLFLKWYHAEILVK